MPIFIPSRSPLRAALLVLLCILILVATTLVLVHAGVDHTLAAGMTPDVVIHSH